MTSEITIFSAKKIVTMNPSNPEGTHVAVRDGRILGVGTLDEVAGWGDYTLDETFKDKVLLPGFVEAHSHSFEGLFAMYPYVGYFDRPIADGSIAPGIKNYDDLIARLKEIDASLEPDQSLIAVGFDPIYFTGQPRLNTQHLDEVSTTRTIFVWHASGHLATVNSAALNRYGVTAETDVEGVSLGADGQPNGELHEPPAMSLISDELHELLYAASDEATVWHFGNAMRNAGITTATDLAGTMVTNPATETTMRRIVNDDNFPCRIAVYNTPALPGVSADFDQVAQQISDMRANQSEKLLIPGVKFVLDGSIQGWTAVMNWPGYFTGDDHGQLLFVPEQLKDAMLPFHKAGLNIHMHCNGDATIDLAIETVDDLLREVAWLDHRHTIQHSQLQTSAHYRKMANLGMCANIFTNHIWYWGDQHYEMTVGPERANWMEACATAKREGVHFSMHSDAHVTPPGHLHTMWCAVNRVTPKGRVLGEYEKISAYDALYACTVDAAYQIHMDHEIGSIEAGKMADFAVLDESPLDVDPMNIKDISVWGTVVGGKKFQSTRSS